MKKKFINFFLIIFMFLTMVGVNQNIHDDFVPVYATATEADLVSDNPTGKTLYVMDPDGVLHTDVPKEPGSLVAFVDVKYSSNDFTIELTDNGSNVYVGDFSQVSAPLGGLLGMTIQIIYTDPQGVEHKTNKADIGSSFIEALKGDFNNQDALIAIEKDSNNNLIINSDTNIFNGSNYLFYAYQGEVGDVIYCEYSNDRLNKDGVIVSYDIPMVLTKYRYGDLPVYRACIYAFADHYYISSLKFKVIKHTGVEDLTKRVTPITSNTGYSTWHAKVYYQTEPVQEHYDNWHEFYEIGNPYSVNFYWGSLDNQSYGGGYKSFTAGKEEKYLITVPSNPTTGGYSFIGWKNARTGEMEDFSEGDTIFVTKSVDYIAQWKEGVCVHLYVDPRFVEKTHNTTNITNVKLLLSDSTGSILFKEFDMTYCPKTGYYKLIVSIGNQDYDDMRSIKSCKLTYRLGNITYQTNVMSTPTIDNNNISHKQYHVVVPTTPNFDNHISKGYRFEKLYTITYHYGDNWDIIYRRFPVSLWEIKPLFIEKEGHVLEGWYTSLQNKNTEINPNTRFEKQVLRNNISLYANYIPNNDYYFYVDNYQNIEWKPSSITMFNDYFLNYSKTIEIPSYDAKDLGHNIYQIKIDISKSFDQCYISGIPSSGSIATAKVRTETKPLLTEYTYFDITPKKTIENGLRVNIINTELYENCLVGAQKLPYDEVHNKNAFRFTMGVPSQIDDYYQNPYDPTLPSIGQTNLGFKIIFIEENSCYIGFWNFNEKYKSDSIRLDNLYTKDTDYDGMTYNGFYSLTVRDDVAFRYDNFSHIIIIGVYKNNQNELKVVKATEYQIVPRASGNVDIYYQQNHVIHNGK